MTSVELLELEGYGQRSSSFRFDVLDLGLQRVGTLEPGAGTATVQNDGGRAVHRTMRGLKVPAPALGDLNPMVDRIRPVMVLQDGSEWPLGVFLFADASWARRTYGRDLSATLVDQGLVLDQEADRAFGFPAGTNVRDALVNVLELSPVVAFDVAPTSVTLGAWIVWRPDAHWLKVLNDLAAMAGFFPAYFDHAGLCRLRPVPDLASTDPVATYIAGGRIIDGSIAESDDLLDAPNRYRVIGTGSTDAPIVGVYDLPDDAPHSVAARGFAVTRTLQMQGIATSADAVVAAKAAAAQDDAGFASASFASPPDPRHDTYDVVDFLGERWRELSWTMALREGAPMRHELRRVY